MPQNDYKSTPMQELRGPEAEAWAEWALVTSDLSYCLERVSLFKEIIDDERTKIASSLYRDAIITFISCFDKSVKTHLSKDEVYGAVSGGLEYFSYLEGLRHSWVAHRSGPTRQAVVGIIVEEGSGRISYGQLIQQYLHPSAAEVDQFYSFINAARNVAQNNMKKAHDATIAKFEALPEHAAKSFPVTSITIPEAKDHRAGRRKFQNTIRNRKKTNVIANQLSSHQGLVAELRMVLGILRRPNVLGEEHPGTLNVRSKIAAQKGFQGHFIDAEAELRAVWEIQKRHDDLGAEHLDTLITHACIASQMGSQGRYTDAEAEFRTVWEIVRRPDMFGDEHPNTLNTRANVASQMGIQGRYTDAEAELRAVWEIQKRHDDLGEEHLDTLVVRANIANLMGNQRHYTDAEAELRAVWEILRRPDVLGEEHPDTLITRAQIAEQMSSQNFYTDAEAKLRAVLGILRRPDVLGEEHSRIMRVKFCLAKTLDPQGKHEEATELLADLRKNMLVQITDNHVWIKELDAFLAAREF